MTVKEYIEDFYILDIRTGQRERDEEKFARYINGLRYENQDELSMMSVRKVEDVYHFLLKEEEKLARKKNPMRKRQNPNPKQKQGSYP
jgi:hypothetical protein